MADPERERFERWYDAQPDGRLQPWDVWQAACQDAIAQGHACIYALDGGGNLYKRYRTAQCNAGDRPTPCPECHNANGRYEGCGRGFGTSGPAADGVKEVPRD